MNTYPTGLDKHRVAAHEPADVQRGKVVYSPVKSLWFLVMACAGIVGGVFTFSWQAFALFLVTTGTVLLFGHSLGSHRKLIHNSYQCPKWLEYVFVYLGVQVGLAGPIGLLKQHELRDYAQRLANCHDYLKHGRSFWVDAWWQLNCELRLQNPPNIRVEPGIANDRFYQFLERTWMAQQLPWVLLFYAWGGWSFLFWGVCARVTACVFGHWMIGYFAHNHGDMHFHVDGAAVQGRNIRLTSILTMGECWHNNHHAYPGSARLGLAPGEWDPGWWVLLALRRAGLAWGFVLPHDLPHRAELVLLDAPALVEPKYRENEPSFSLSPISFSEMIALCRNSETSRGSTENLRIEWPASLLSERVLKCIIGKGIDVICNPAARRLSLKMDASEISGLPAFLLATARRNWVAQCFALTLLPLGMLAERTRVSFACGAAHG